MVSKSDEYSNKDIFNIKKTKENFSEWYLELVRRAKLVDQRSPVKGFDVFMPNSYEMWERIRDFLDVEFRKLNVRNAYFPLLIPETLLREEAEHFEGFVPEVAWVTHGGDKKLDVKLAIRPTSETIMYYMYRLWIRSYQDLPLKINQWNNIVRWETKATKPFLRSREFLWQEGHTAHATCEDADRMVVESLTAYKKALDELLAIPSMFVKRPDWDKFAGALYTVSLETLMPDGKVLQAGTSHNLGQNFSKPFEIKFINEKNEEDFVWQTSWGVSTRLIGATVMEHGDDHGLVLPFNLAPTQIVIIPILFKGKEKSVLDKCTEIKKSLGEYRVSIDNSDERPGAKHYYWELMGAPIRLEIGPKDIENNQVVLVRRDKPEKQTVKIKDLKKSLEIASKETYSALYKKAENYFNSNMFEADNKEKVKEILNNDGGMVKVPFCSVSMEGKECADILKDFVGGGEVRGTKFPQDEKGKGNCIICGKKAGYMVYVAKAY